MMNDAPYSHELNSALAMRKERDRKKKLRF